MKIGPKEQALREQREARKPKSLLDAVFSGEMSVAEALNMAERKTGRNVFTGKKLRKKRKQK